MRCDRELDRATLSLPALATTRYILHGMSLGVTILSIGAAILGAVLGLFYLKGRLESPTLGRIAYSELMMRFTVIAVALIAIGILLIVGQLFS